MLESQLADLKKKVKEQRDEATSLKKDLAAAHSLESSLEETKKEAESIK